MKRSLAVNPAGFAKSSRWRNRHFPRHKPRWSLGRRSPRLLVLAVPVMTLVTAGAVGAVSSAGPRSRPASAAVQAAPSHPLDPLSASEIATAFRVIEADSRFPRGAFFPLVGLKEPPKSEVLAWSPGQPFRREAFAQVYNRRDNRLFEAVVDLRQEKVVSWVEREPARRLCDRVPRRRQARPPRRALEEGHARPRAQPR